MSPLSPVCFYCADQNPSRDRSRGITSYTYELLSHLQQIIALKAIVSKSSFAIPNSIERISLPFRTDNLAGRLVADHFHPALVGDIRARIWHYPKGFLPLVLPSDVKKVGTVADVMLQHEADHHPDARPKLAFAYWLGMLKHSLRHLDLVITVSESSKTGIQEFCSRHNLPQRPIVVTYQGVTVSPPTAQQGKEDHVVHLASKLPYKGTRWLLQQWVGLIASGATLPRLELVGTLDPIAQELYSKIPNANLRPSLPRSELESVIGGARALLMSSEIEGFGRAAVEAYLLNTPVVYPRGTAIEEIVGSHSAGGFERDRDSFEAALQQVMSMPITAVEEKATVLRRRYSWENAVELTLGAYRSVLN